MVKTPMPVDFPNADTRDKWIADNATYFTVMLRRNRRYVRTELADLKTAEQVARDAVALEPDMRLIIYAVYDPTGASPLSAYVKTISIKDLGVHRANPS